MSRLSSVPRSAGCLKLPVVCFVLICPILSLCQTPVRSVLCRDGNGVFDAEFPTGVHVHIGATRNPGVALAARACAAKLSWEKQELMVSPGASELDLDAFGVDFGDGVPAAAFQVRKSNSACCVEYRIYSLTKPPRLLRTISGGEFFNACDVDLDGRVEIWTNDAATVDGFEKLALRELDSAPSVVLRFAHGQLADVSAEFQPYFDNQITRIQNGIHPQDLEDFKHSDGALAAPSTPASTERLRRLREVKVKVLEIVWAYLYSGREQEAWHALTAMWPAADVDRIHAALAKMRAEGMHSQTDQTSPRPVRARKKHARIFDTVSRQGAARSLEVMPPQAILLEFPAAPEIQPANPREDLLDLVIDAAGKVRSVEPAGKNGSLPPERVGAAFSWKFIPAFKDSRAVASRIRISVSPKQ